MTSITLDLFSGKGRQIDSIPVPVVSLKNYHDQLLRFAKNRRAQEYTTSSQKHIVCRELFQKTQNEIFFFPYFRGKNVSLASLLSGKLFFLKGIYGWNFILIFTPVFTHDKPSKGLFFAKTSEFSQEKTYPQGADSAETFSLSTYCASILVSEHGSIAEDSEGQLFLQGITVSLLQTLNHQCKSILVQRRDIFASPKPPLREEDLSSLEPKSCKFIKISCFCRQKDFVYSTHFPVLTPEEVQEKLRNNIAKRLAKYGASDIRYRISDTKEIVTKGESSNSLLIVAPPMLEADVPFGSCREGELFFSYSDQFECTLQLLFFPYLFSVHQITPRNTRRCVQNWYIKDVDPLVKCCKARSATVFSFPGIKLVPSSESEYKITGMKVELVAALRGNCWGVFCSSEKKMPLSSSNTPERSLPLDSPTPGPSGLGYSKPSATLSQSTVTVSVSPEKQGKQTQKRRSPLPGHSGFRHHPYPYGPLPFCGDLCSYRSPITPHPQAVATVAVSPESESPHTQQRSRSPLPKPSGVSNHPYPYGPLPFCGYFYSYRSPIIPHPQAAATVAVSPESESPQIQQKSRSPLTDPSGVRHQMIRPIPIHSSAASIVSVLPERQSQQTPHTQQRDIRNPVLGPSAVRHNPYPQHGPWSFSEGSHPLMPVLPLSASAVRPFSAALELLRYNISVEESLEHSRRAEEANASVSVGAVQQTPIWRPDEESSNVEILPQVQAENSDADTDIDVEN